MALRAGYYGLKRVLIDKLFKLPGIEEIGDGLTLDDGVLTGDAGSVVANPEGSATSGNLTKLKVGDDIYNVPDTTYSDATTTTSGLMSAADKTKINNLTTIQTVTHNDPYTQGDWTVSYTEYYIGNIGFITGTIVSSSDVAAGELVTLNTDQVISHYPVADACGSLFSSKSSSDRKPIANIRLGSNGKIVVAGEFAAGRSNNFSVMFIFSAVSRELASAPEEIVKDEIEEPVVEKKTTRKKSTAKADTQEEV